MATAMTRTPGREHRERDVSTDRSVSPYRVRRREEERLGAVARVLAIVASILLVLITAQRAGFHVVVPILPG